MVKVPGKRESRAPAPSVSARAAALVPGWVPLAIAVCGFGLTLSPEELPWAWRIVGAALLAAGSFWLGQDRQHDPHDRTRIVQLERALLTMEVLRREGDDASAVRPDGKGSRAAPSPDGVAAPPRGAPGRGAASGGRPVDLDAPLPGE